jgi:hypothetical protein
VNCRKPCMQGTASPRQASDPPSLSPPAPMTVYSVFPRSMTWPLPCTGSVFTTSSCLSCHRAATLDPLGHRIPRTKPTCLSTHRRPHRHRPFALVLHLHHVNQAATYTCNTQSRVSPHHVVNHLSIRSDHPPVLECSSPHPPRPLFSPSELHSLELVVHGSMGATIRSPVASLSPLEFEL